QEFYDGCRAALVPGGVLAGNLYATDAAAHLEKLRRAFGAERVMTLAEARQSNQVVFAWTGDPFPQGRIDLPALAKAMPRGVARQLADVFQRVATAWDAR